MSGTRFRALDALMVCALFAVSAFVCFTAMGAYRAAGIQPAFYQGNFEPAVMMACGYGFHTTTAQALPASLRAFLDLKTNTFSCADLSPDLPLVTVTWNGTWYYLYGATALVWKLTGLSWTALDALVALLGGITTVMLFALFRLVSGPWLAAVAALLLTMSPSNLTSLLSLRDYSKAPFVLASVFVLALLVARPMTRVVTIALAVVFGAIVGFGYGFRGDLIVMAPFGVAVIALFLPGASFSDLRRSLVPATAAAAMFLIVAAPPLRGLNTGGCQFHYSLLGLTTPLLHEAAVEPALYSVGDHFTDTFVDLKVGDYANRVLGRRAPILCSPDYDTASGALFRRYAMTFPADLAVHAYGAVLIIARAGFEIPDMPFPLPSWLEGRFTRAGYRWMNLVTHVTSFAGPLVTVLAFAGAWSTSARLGLALTGFVLFLGGYPAIEFEARHWFHLRFIPWWSGVFVATMLLRNRAQGWTWDGARRVAFGVMGTLVALAVALTALRTVQAREVRALIDRYTAAATAPLALSRGHSSVDVDWRPLDYGSLPEHRSSDLLVVTLDPNLCVGSDPLAIRVLYEADAPSHDLTTTITLVRPFASAAPPRLFVPVFANGFQDHTYLRFTGLEAVGRPAGCVADVSRVVDPTALQMWIQVQVPGDWRQRPWYQTLRRPRIFR